MEGGGGKRRQRHASRQKRASFAAKSYKPRGLNLATSDQRPTAVAPGLSPGLELGPSDKLGPSGDISEQLHSSHSLCFPFRVLRALSFRSSTQIWHDQLPRDAMSWMRVSRICGPLGNFFPFLLGVPQSLQLQPDQVTVQVVWTL